MIKQESFWIAILSILAAIAPVRAAEEGPPRKPIFRDFMGICGHTVTFDARRYATTCRLVRDYHPLDWDTGDDPSLLPRFPRARNGVDWQEVYGGWKGVGFDTEVSIMFDNLAAKSWKEPARDALNYGRAFARAFGPGSALKLVSCVEVGNEPGLYGDATYRTIFTNMARGFREGDHALKVGPCALKTGPSDRYARSVSCLEGVSDLYDFLNIHTYAEIQGYPTWKRTYPEDPDVDFLHSVRRLVDWRDQKAQGKEVRITEFGWDASSKPAPASGTFSQWVGSTETEQARYLVRSFLLFSAMDVTRAYLFFFDDKDEPQVHGSSGLTRNGKPKAAFYAVAHLFKTLGEYRFRKVILKKSGETFVYEYVHGDDPDRRIWAVWSPTGSNREGKVTLKLDGFHILSVEQMPLTKDEPPAERSEIHEGVVTVHVGESPVFLLGTFKTEQR